MSDSDQTTIPIRSSSTELPEEKQPPKHQRRLFGELFRFFKVTCYTTILVVAGWGCWHFLSPSSNVDNADAIADLEGFESAPAFPHVPKPDNADADSSISMDLAVPLPNDPALAESTAIFETSTSVSSKGAEVWLTGTIEEADSAPRSNSPLRISGSPNDPSTVR